MGWNQANANSIGLITACFWHIMACLQTYGQTRPKWNIIWLNLFALVRPYSANIPPSWTSCPHAAKLLLKLWWFIAICTKKNTSMKYKSKFQSKNKGIFLWMLSVFVPISYQTSIFSISKKNMKSDDCINRLAGMVPIIWYYSRNPSTIGNAHVYNQHCGY